MSWELYSLNALCLRKLAILTFFMSPDLSLWTGSKLCDRLPLHNILNVIYLIVFYIFKKKPETKGICVINQFSSVQLLSHVQLFATPWTAAHQSSLSITNSRSLLKLMSIESVMPSNHLILCHPLLLLPSIVPSIRVFSSESVLHIRWPKYWSFSLSIGPSNEYSGLISFRMD